jgi:hypothetical protein
VFSSVLGNFKRRRTAPKENVVLTDQPNHDQIGIVECRLLGEHKPFWTHTGIRMCIRCGEPLAVNTLGDVYDTRSP